MEELEVNKDKKVKLNNKEERIKKKGARFVGEFSKDDNSTIEAFNAFLERCNDKEIGRKITWSDLFKHLVLSNDNEKTIKEIQDSVLTIEDKVNLKLKELNIKDGNKLTILDLAAKALKIQ